MKWAGRVLWLAVTVAILFSIPRLPWALVAAQLARVQPGWVAAAIGANLLILPLWAQEWRLFVPVGTRVSMATMFEIVASTAAVLNSVPFFAGEASGVALLMARAGLTRGAALSVLALDQLLVGFAKLAVLATAALYAPLPTWLQAGVLSLAASVVALQVALVALAHRWATARDLLMKHPTRTRRFVASLVEWGVHFEALRDWRRISRVALLSLGKKGAEVLGVVAIQLAFALEPSFGSAALVVASLAVTTLLPVSPANLGVYEATVFAVNRYLGIPAETALGVALVQHMCFLVPPLVTGYATMTVRQLLPRRLGAS